MSHYTSFYVIDNESCIIWLEVIVSHVELRLVWNKSQEGMVRWERREKKKTSKCSVNEVMTLKEYKITNIDVPGT